MRRDVRDEILKSFLIFNSALREEVRDIRRLLAARQAEAKYNPNWRLQPRAPRGTTEGGQWVGGGGAAKPSAGRTPKQSHRDEEEEPVSERPVNFFDPMDDNPYFWRLTEAGLLPENASVADFYNLRFDLISLPGREFTEVARRVGMTPAELVYELDRGSSVMADRAITLVEGIFDNPGIAGTNIVARDRAFREYVRLSGVRPEHQHRMLREILLLAGFSEDEYRQHQLDVGIGSQFAFLLGGGGPAATTAIAPRAARIFSMPTSVWSLGPARRGRVIEAALGHNLPANYRIIDRFSDNGLATSIKSVDLNSATYHRPETLYRKLRGFVDHVRGFRGDDYAGRRIVESEIAGWALDLVVPHAGTPAQQRVIEEIIAYARSRDVIVEVIVYP